MAQAVDEQGDHALGAARAGVVGRHAQAGHRAEKLVGVDVGAHLAGGDRRLEQCAEGRPESPVEVAWQIVERRIARMQGLGEPALGSDERRVSLHPARQGFEGLVRVREHGRDVGAGVDLTAEDGGDQIGALRKVPVEGAKADPGLVRNLPHRRIDARGCEYRLGGEEQGVEAALGVGAHPAFRSAPRLHVFITIFWLVDHNALLINGTVIHINTER